MIKTVTLLPALIVSSLWLTGCSGGSNPCGEGSGKIKDEALCAGVKAEQMPGATEDYYADMDYGISKRPDELLKRLQPYFPDINQDEAVKRFARGRNNWVVWTAGNDRLWDELSRATFGNLDLLKTISNYDDNHANGSKGKPLAYSRTNRWTKLGLVNEPCFTKNSKPRDDRFGLRLDVRDPNCVPDPFENEEKYPGVKIGARGKNIPVGSYYGYATGIVGLRLFTNPNFDEQAEADWDSERYYSDPDYYNQKDLVKPYRVGMSCGFCHVGPNPSNPPADFENPTWAELNSNPGAQYFWVDRILLWDENDENYVNQIFHTSKPGALDTSLVSTDYINNPRTMNAIYNLGARLELSTKWGKEKLKGGELNNKQFNDYIPNGHPLTEFFQAPNTVYAPRVLKDGADSVGSLGALNRVYINIGLFSEEWLEHFNPVVGGKKDSPIEIAVAQKNSTYWNANEAQTPDVALFFLGSATPDLLKEAPGGAKYQRATGQQLALGKKIFAENCARCHSSKLPDYVFNNYFSDKGCVNKNYLSCFDDYWKHTKTDSFKRAMHRVVAAPDFLSENYLSNELRIPVTLLETNACSPLARNGLANNIWDNFSSSSYKSLPGVGKIKVQHPYTQEAYDWTMPAGGRGYTRPPSLASLWSTAPFLLNNSLGPFRYEGTVDARMASFNKSIEQLLWPEKRTYSGQPSGDAVADSHNDDVSYPFEVMTRSGKTHPGYIQVTTKDSYLELAPGYLPNTLSKFFNPLQRWFPKIFKPEGIKVGPIPKGTPTNLLYNTDLTHFDKNKVKLGYRLIKDLKNLPKDATGDEAKKAFKNIVKPLLKDSTCPDFVMNRGHYFGTDYLPASEGETPLTDAEKRALIEFLKTF